MLAIFLLCIVGFAIAQQPKPCVTPLQWEGGLFDYGEKVNFAVRGRLSYDGVYHRERLIEIVDVGGQPEQAYDVIALFDLQTEYVYNFRARNCTRRTLTRPWREFGIPSNASSYGEAYVGSSALPSAGLLVTRWGFNVTTPSGDKVRVFGIWTYQDCLPVLSVRHSQQYGRSQVSFFDINAGIRDPSVFIPRQECLTEQEWAMRDTLFGVPAKK